MNQGSINGDQIKFKDTHILDYSYKTNSSINNTNDLKNTQVIHNLKVVNLSHSKSKKYNFESGFNSEYYFRGIWA